MDYGWSEYHGVMMEYDYSNCRVFLSRGTGIIAALVRWQTRSQWSHCGLLLPDGSVIESVSGDGVHNVNLTDTEGYEFFVVEGMAPEQWKMAIDWAFLQVGKKYDYWSVVRFVWRGHFPENDKLYCAELVFEALAKAGVNLLDRIVSWEVAPQHIGISPLLVSNTLNQDTGGSVGDSQLNKASE